MKLNISSFKKIFSKVKGNEPIKKKALYRPHRDWIVIIVLFGSLVVLSVALHYGLYILADREAIFNKTAEQEVFNAALRREALNEAVQVFDARSANTAAFDQNRAFLIDPS